MGDKIHAINGNIVVPTEQSFGWGIPSDPQQVQSGGPRIILVDSDPNGVVQAPKGSFALDRGAPTIWQNTDGGMSWSDAGAIVAPPGPSLQSDASVASTNGTEYPQDAFSGSTITIAEDGDYQLTFEAQYTCSGTGGLGGTVFNSFVVALDIDGTPIPVGSLTGADSRLWDSKGSIIASGSGVVSLLGNAVFTTKLSLTSGQTVSIAFGFPATQPGATILTATLNARNLSLIKVT